MLIELFRQGEERPRPQKEQNLLPLHQLEKKTLQTKEIPILSLVED